MELHCSGAARRRRGAKGPSRRVESPPGGTSTSAHVQHRCATAQPPALHPAPCTPRPPHPPSTRMAGGRRPKDQGQRAHDFARRAGATRTRPACALPHPAFAPRPPHLHLPLHHPIASTQPFAPALSARTVNRRLARRTSAVASAGNVMHARCLTAPGSPPRRSTCGCSHIGRVCVARSGGLDPPPPRGAPWKPRERSRGPRAGQRCAATRTQPSPLALAHARTCLESQEWCGGRQRCLPGVGVGLGVGAGIGVVVGTGVGTGVRMGGARWTQQARALWFLACVLASRWFLCGRGGG